MTRAVSLGTKIKQLDALLGTRDLNEREQDFVRKLVSITGNGQNTTDLSEGRVEWLEDLWARHFA